MEEGESLPLMFLGLHSFCHNQATHTFFQIKTHFDPRRSLSANNISGKVHLSWI